MKSITWIVGDARDGHPTHTEDSPKKPTPTKGFAIVGIHTRIDDALCIHGGLSSPCRIEAPLTPKPAPTKKGTLI